MEANKSECEKCIRIAQGAASSGDYPKALKFLSKAEKLYPSELITSRYYSLKTRSFVVF
jgi:hypothetical protein